MRKAKSKRQTTKTSKRSMTLGVVSRGKTKSIKRVRPKTAKQSASKKRREELLSVPAATRQKHNYHSGQKPSIDTTTKHGNTHSTQPLSGVAKMNQGTLLRLYKLSRLA